MSRRSSVEKIDWYVSDLISAPGSGILPAVSGCIYSPKSVVMCSHGGGTLEAELVSNGVPFLHVHVAANTCLDVNFPKGFELGIGSGVDIVVLANDGSLNLYYSKYDENPGVTKVASRASTYSGAQSVRTPNQFGVDAKT